MTNRGPNAPVVVWTACFLWLTSMFAITWSLILFFSVGDILLLTETDLVNALVLLSGIIMLPANIHMLYAIANGKRIDHKAKVVCCPLWLCIIWIVLINVFGAVLCIQRISSCKHTTEKIMQTSMKHYRSLPKYKHFMDNLQWSLKCCGMTSYRDWFTRDWYDRIRDYEWNPSKMRNTYTNKASEVDSVPLSCCKSGSCISNYLTELGTYSINTTGCSRLMYRVIIISMSAHLTLFISIILAELLVLKNISKQNPDIWPPTLDTTREVYNVKHIMNIKENFDDFSGSEQINPEDSDLE